MTKRSVPRRHRRRRGSNSARSRPRARSRCRPPTGRAVSPSRPTSPGQLSAPAAGQRDPATPTGRLRRAARLVHAEGAYANLVLPKLLAERRIIGPRRRLRHRAAGRDVPPRGNLRPDPRGRGRTRDLLAAARRGGPAPAGHAPLLGMRVPAHAAVAATVDLGRRHGGRAGHRAGQRRAAPGRRPVLGGMDRRARRRARSGRTPGADAPPIRGGSSRRTPSCCRPTSSRRRCWPTTSRPQVTLAVRPGLADGRRNCSPPGPSPGRCRPFAATLVREPGRAGRRPPGHGRRPGRGIAAGGLGAELGRRRPTGWWLDLCAGPGGKTALLTGLAAERIARGPVLAAELDAPPGPAGRAGAVRAYPRPADGRGGRRHPAGLAGRVIQPGAGRRALHRSGGAPPAARSRVGGGPPPTSSSCTRCRRGCCAARWPRSDPAAWSRTSPARLTAGRPPTWSSEVLASAMNPRVLDRRGLERVARTGRCASSGPYLQLWPHRHGTDAMFAAYLRRTG